MESWVFPRHYFVYFCYCCGSADVEEDLDCSYYVAGSFGVRGKWVERFSGARLFSSGDGPIWKTSYLLLF